MAARLEAEEECREAPLQKGAPKGLAPHEAAARARAAAIMKQLGAGVPCSYVWGAAHCVFNCCYVCVPLCVQMLLRVCVPMCSTAAT